MSLFHAALQPALDSSGNPISGATWNFYTTGTLTPASVYTTNALTTAHGSTVTANSAGRFANVFLDDGVTYRAILKDAGGTTIKDIDPVNTGTAVAGTPAAMAAIPAGEGQRAYVTETGREGTFIFSTANLSAQVTADAYQAIYVAPSSDTTGASGAWVRVVEGNLYRLSWWGVTAGTNATARFHSALKVIPEGARLEVPPYGLNIDNNTAQIALGLKSHLPITKPVEIFGTRGKSILTLTHNASQDGTFVVMASNVKIHGLTLTGLNDAANNSSNACPIIIGPRQYHTDDVIPEIENVEIYDNHIYNCTSGIRASYQPQIVAGVPLSITPRRIKIYNNHIDVSYQHIRPQADDIEIFGNTLVLAAGTASRPFQHVFRILGCKNVDIHDNTIVNNITAAPFSIQSSGVDGYPVGFNGELAGDDDGVNKHEDFRIARDVFIHHNTIYSSVGCTALDIQRSADTISFTNNSYNSPLTLTAVVSAVVISDNGPMAQSTVIVKNNTFRGVSQFLSALACNCKHLVFAGNTGLGNELGTNFGDVASTITITSNGLDTSNAAIVGVDLFECYDNSFASKGGGQTYGVNITATNAGNLAIVYNNRWSEDGGAVNALKIAGGGAGSIISSAGGAPVLWSAGAYDDPSNPTGWQQGENIRYPDGTWARLSANVKPYNGTDAL